MFSLRELDPTRFPMPAWAEQLFDRLESNRSINPGGTEIDLSEIVRLIGNALEVDVCSLYRFEQASQELVLAATVGLNWQCVDELRMGLGEGLVGLAGEELVTVMTADAPQHPRFKYFPDAGEDPFHSLLATPIMRGEELRGVLVIQTIERRLFTPDECQLVSGTAGELSEFV